MRGWAANEVLWINTHIQIHANPLKQFYKQSFSRSNPNGAAHRLTPQAKSQIHTQLRRYSF